MTGNSVYCFCFGLIIINFHITIDFGVIIICNTGIIGIYDCSKAQSRAHNVFVYKQRIEVNFFNFDDQTTTPTKTTGIRIPGPNGIDTNRIMVLNRNEVASLINFGNNCFIYRPVYADQSFLAVYKDVTTW